MKHLLILFLALAHLAQGATTYANLDGAQTLTNKTLASPTITGTPTGITKSHVGLGNVDNTSDANKPISIAQAAGFAGKQDTLVSGTNIKTVNGQSVLGSGNLTVSGGGNLTAADGVPSNGDGADGEYRLNYLSGIIYKKVAGTWVANTVNEPNQIIFATGLPADGTGVDGDMAVLYTSGQISGLAQKSAGTWTQIASAAQAEKRASANDVIEMVDHFISGPTITTAGQATGTLGWLFAIPVGSGGGAKQMGIGNGPGIGVMKLQAGTTAGNTTMLYFANGTDGTTGPFTVNDLKRYNRFRMAWVFKFDTIGDMHIGITNMPNAASAPTRFVGIRALNGTTNFQYVATNGTPVTVDTLVPVDTAWHRFEVGWDSATNEWLMTLDGVTSRLAKTLDDAHSVTLAMWVTTRSVGFQALYIDSFRFYGEMP